MSEHHSFISAMETYQLTSSFVCALSLTTSQQRLYLDVYSSFNLCTWRPSDPLYTPVGDELMPAGSLLLMTSPQATP
jgi:hypothetical protein